jgi:hypothetical protein
MREKGRSTKLTLGLDLHQIKHFSPAVRGVYGAGDQQPDLLVIVDTDVEPIMRRRTDASKVRRTF